MANPGTYLKDVKDGAGSTFKSLWHSTDRDNKATAGEAPVVRDLDVAGVLQQVLTELLAQGANAATVNVALDIAKFFYGETELEPMRGLIQADENGANTLVVGVADKRIRVLSYKLSASGAVDAKFQSDGEDLTGWAYMPAAGWGEVEPFNGAGYFESATGEDLVLFLSDGVAVGGHLTYVLVD